MSSRMARRRKKHRMTELEEQKTEVVGRAVQLEAEVRRLHQAHFYAEAAKNVAVNENAGLRAANEFMYETLRDVAATELDSEEARNEPRRMLERIVATAKGRMDALIVRDETGAEIQPLAGPSGSGPAAPAWPTGPTGPAEDPPPLEEGVG